MPDEKNSSDISARAGASIHLICVYMRSWSLCVIVENMLFTASVLRHNAGKLQSRSAAGLDEKIDEGGNRLLTLPVALQFAKQLRDADHLGTGLFHPAESHLVRC